MAGGGPGRVTTHVLDTSLGKPAQGLRIEVFRIGGGGDRTSLGTVSTNADGRCDGPVIAGTDMRPGVYELVFHAGAYLDATHGPVVGPRFLDVVPIRFGIADAQAHYHVPLLLSPFSYSTYRGS